MELEDEVSRLKDKVYEMDKTVGVFSAIVKQGNEIQEKLSQTLDNLNATVNQMQLTMKEMQFEIRNSTSKIGSLEGKLSNVENAVRQSDDKSKVDFVALVKQNFMGFIAIIVLVLHTVGIIK